MLNVFFNPADAIEDAKKYGEWVITIAALVISAVLIAVTPMIVMKSLMWKISLAVGLGVIIGPFIGALAYKIVLSILGADNARYHECMNSIVYSIAPLSVALLTAAVLMLIPYAGTYLAMLAVFTGMIVGVSTQVKAIVELTETDLLTALASIWIVASGAVMASYVVSITSFLAMFSKIIAAAALVPIA